MEYIDGREDAIMKKWILEHRKSVTTGIIVIAIILIGIATYLFHTYFKGEYELAELLYYSSQIISATFVISGTVIAVWQYYVSCVDSKRNLDLVCVQKAIDLSEYYKDNILSQIAPIEYIFENSGINDIISKIDKSKMKFFDEKEMKTFLTDDDIKELNFGFYLLFGGAL